jgi:hypothetical protein
MNQERDTPKFSGIADPRCRCTPDRLCHRCAPSSPGAYARIIEWNYLWNILIYVSREFNYQIPDRFRGKFRDPWNDAVKHNNAEIKNEGESR